MIIYLVSCSSKKQFDISPAKDMYSSSLFKYSRKYAEKHADLWFILSSKYGLLSPDDTIVTYDEYIGDKSNKEVAEWADTVYEKLKHIAPGNTFVFLAGKKYRTALSQLIIKNGGSCQAPMSGLGIGQQLAWLKKEIKK